MSSKYDVGPNSQEDEFGYSQKRLIHPSSSNGNSISQTLASSQGYFTNSQAILLLPPLQNVPFEYPDSQDILKDVLDDSIFLPLQPESNFAAVGRVQNERKNENGATLSDSLSELIANNSFELGQMADEMEELSSGILGPSIQFPEFQTPPRSTEPEGDVFGIEYGHAGHMNLSHNVKVEPAETPRGSAKSNEQLHYENQNESEDSSQDESQGNRIPVLDSFPGIYNFSVAPQFVTLLKKCVYVSQLNKIFCSNNHFVLFDIKLDFDKVEYRKLTIQAMIYYSSNTLILNKGIRQCVECCKAEKREPLDQNGLSISGRLIRCDSPKAVYFRRRRLHDCVETPLERLQTGARSIKRNYMFTCLSSCHSKIKESKDWTLMFYLMDGKTELGRQAYNLKISKCPGRDSTTEMKKYLQRQQSLSLGKLNAISQFKQEPIDPPETHNQEDPIAATPPKRVRLSRESNPCEARPGENVMNERQNDSQRPSTSRAAYGVEPPEVANIPIDSPQRRKRQAATVPETDSEPFTSLEGSQSFKVNTLLTRIAENANFATGQLKQPKPNHSNKEFYSNWFKQLNYLDKQMAFFRTHVDVEGTEDSLVEDADETLKPGEGVEEDQREAEGSNY